MKVIYPYIYIYIYIYVYIYMRVGYGKALPRVVFVLNDKVPPRAVQRTHLFS